MSRIYPVVFRWTEVDVVSKDGVVFRRMAMVPLKRYGNVAGRQYHDGEDYPLVPLEARSRASHNQYFAALGEGFKNLPEKIAPRFPTVEHLRGWLLVETGWFEEAEWHMASGADAKKLAARVRLDHPYARIMPNGSNVVVRYPKSQSAANMGKAEFEASKKDVLDLLESLVGVPEGSLMREAGQIA